MLARDRLAYWIVETTGNTTVATCAIARRRRPCGVCAPSTLTHQEKTSISFVTFSPVGCLWEIQFFSDGLLCDSVYAHSSLTDLSFASQSPHDQAPMQRVLHGS